MTDLIERLRIAGDTGTGMRANGCVFGICHEAADRIAALEAEASERERRGLERAAAEADTVYRDWVAMRDEGRMSKLTAQTYADMAFYIAGRIRALIPETPAREGE